MISYGLIMFWCVQDHEKSMYLLICHPLCSICSISKSLSCSRPFLCKLWKLYV